MPELPDLLYYEEKLNEALPGKVITDFKIMDPVVVRNMTGRQLPEQVLNRTFGLVERRGAYLHWSWPDLEIAIHCMLAGKLQYANRNKAKLSATCLVFGLELEWELRYADNKSMGKVYFFEPRDRDQIPNLVNNATYILSEAFTLDKLKSLIHKKRQQIRVFLMDKALIDTIGNAYADEILFAAKIHPKTPCNQLAPDSLKALHKSIIGVMQESIAYIKKRAEPMEIKIRDHVKVRNRINEACPVCGTKIRRANVVGYDSFFCPSCQPATKEQFIPW